LRVRMLRNRIESLGASGETENRTAPTLGGQKA
jgi:hypothetical protein